MYLQINVVEEHRDVQRIVWRSNSNEPVRDFRLNVVSFGVNSSPWLALRTMKQLAQEGKASHPRASKILENGLYMDDVCVGFATVSEALKAKAELIDLLGGAGFQLHKWCSNSLEVVENQRIPKFHNTNDPKYQTQQQPQQTPDLSSRLMQTDNRLLQTEPIQRMLPPDNSRMISADGSRILTESSHLLPDNRELITNDGTRLLVNVIEPSRLLLNDNTRLMVNENRLLTQDNRLINNVNINENNRLLADNSRLLTNDNARHLTVIESSRILADKYLANYDPYHRGHL
ncbi:hypothetical protein NQ317_017401 [Molorchus minor]|uniref:Uncharacterized protein n=1 Tax=Molorchus minor TaxID=1323400 RepID=A0ABQ9IVB8_9CUCU|nr:hypothetical protein NQ317_017401 [Molorchus minor]